MAIVKMNKFTLIAFENQKNSLLEKMQALENVHFTSVDDKYINEETSKEIFIRDDENMVISEIEDKLSKVNFAIGLLDKYAEKKGFIKNLKEGKIEIGYENLKSIYEKSQWENTYNELKAKDSEIAANENKISKLKTEIEEVSPWVNLDVEINHIRKLKDVNAYLGVVPSINMENLRIGLDEVADASYIEVVKENPRDFNVLILVHKSQCKEAEEVLKQCGFSKESLGFKGIPKEIVLSDEEEIKRLKEINENLKEEFGGYASHIEEFKFVFEYLSNVLLRAKASDNFIKSNHVVVMEGYYPTEDNDIFVAALKEKLGDTYYLESEEAQGDLEVPVKLKNNSIAAAFEPITEMYSTPRYKEIDPTPLFAPFYILFFGMMLSDAGYGILLFIGTLVALKYFNLESGLRKTVKMFFYLSISTTVWGILYGSYFGMSLIPPVWTKPEDNVMLLMIVSVALGLVQIYVGLGIKAYMLIRDESVAAALMDVGLWYVTLSGAILWLVGATGYLPGIVVTIAKYAMFAGMVGIILTGGRREKSVGAKLGQGFYSLYGITGYVGDLVSYTRLAALGLATGFIGTAFNTMSEMLTGSMIGLVFAALIFAVGHIFNLFINALGSYVHTSRLQYLEFFGKFYEGGGKPFRPLGYQSKYYKLRNENNEEE